MDFSQFHFENAQWLWGIIVVPAVLAVYALFYKGGGYAQTLERFADKHLLPHLLKNRRGKAKSLSKPLLLWSFAWLCGMLAMAGPRWNYTEVEAFRPEKDLVIVLDLSTTMSATDVKPSRVIQARERIEDLLNMSHGLTVGMVAYAAVPHMIVPLTDDAQTLKNLLPAIDTSLVTLQGDNLKSALEMAAKMLGAEPGNSKSILVISDGNFEEGNFAKAANGATIYTMGVGTAEGAPISEENGGWMKDSGGKMLIAKLNVGRLQQLGTYVGTGDTDAGVRSVVARINGKLAGQQNAQKNIRIWQERFYIPAFLLALLLLPLFRKGYVFPVALMLLLSTSHAEAAWMDWFLNKDQQGEKAYDAGDYKSAMEKFNAPYQHGVAAYKAGQYDQAAQSFKAAPGLQAEYNLGNTQLQQNKPQDAISSYENVLKQNPDDAQAKHNLELAKKMLEQQQQQKQDQKKNDQQQDKQQQSQNNQQQDKQQQDKQQQDKQQQSQNNQQQNKQQQDKQQQDKQQQDKQQQDKQQQDKQQSGQKQDGQNQQSQPQSGNDKDKQQSDAQKAQDQKSAGQKAQEQKAQEQKDQAQKDAQAQQQQKQADQQKDRQQNGKPQSAQENPAEGGQQKDNQPSAADSRPRTQQDINADQWLDRIQNDPGSFLKNQFSIEDRKSGLQ